MKDVKKFINSKKRKRKIKKVILMTIVTLVAIIIFIAKAPIFNVESIIFSGNSAIATEALAPLVQDKIGQNIFTVNQTAIKETLQRNKYIKGVTVKIKGISTLEINIKEEAPVYYIKMNEKYIIVNNNLEKIEEVASIEGRNLVEIIGVDLNTILEDNNNSELDSFKEILNKFYPYISENREELRLDALDISNIIDIRGYIGDVEIFFGDDEGLHNKMEKVYSIMLDNTVNLKKGYINVSFEGSPVIKKE
ncbi:cell division protein FtsQ/DivIB [Clostridium celatum]|uniref:POTRA domain protein, FtsQ-type n=1 Tax=Clostridium celatum DSM 1785 TaxID=545697 RepID=L1QH90_9CLOT|nr:FtsQ-type POTRA domain-containing protein [Clostridium celatum]EKY26962.1 POTRA domain protein, FtsQ-type [Clostridium celatum DSM 1785]MCE9654778.1 FtsQ-type POTRA domain-containing protein [Clostridium celatum]MDU3723969.1 FtsQ-type POTRA domain-containing protein [Clostridium celatum]MDU6294823.1 FtsQ-type POTRA domain-containing protein [Clostridium celatum]MDY3359264.1 FtsQ-type POTRA domain-containing protein [Clostridium celatum]